MRDLARGRSGCRPDVELWILPMMNPDGAAAGTRESGAGVDLNRDHIGLEQPETRALHEVARRVRPHIAVDCHEFARDPEPWRARGWEKWPAITMDGMDNPLLDPELVAIARRWVDESAAVAAAAGHDFFRYTVGGVPPGRRASPLGPRPRLRPQRHRHLRRAVVHRRGRGAAGAGGGAPRPRRAGRRLPRAAASLRRRRRALGGGSGGDRASAHRAPLPGSVPTNYIWVNPRGAVLPFPVRERATGRRLDDPDRRTG